MNENYGHTLLFYIPWSQCMFLLYIRLIRINHFAYVLHFPINAQVCHDSEKYICKMFLFINHSCIGGKTFEIYLNVNWRLNMHKIWYYCSIIIRFLFFVSRMNQNALYLFLCVYIFIVYFAVWPPLHLIWCLNICSYTK